MPGKGKWLFFTYFIDDLDCLMLTMLSLVSTLYLDHYTGQLAGMGNVALEPQYVIGSANDVGVKAVPDWHNHIDIYAIYGNALTGAGTYTNRFQEVRGKLTSLYTIYKSDGIFSINTGLYSLLAYRLHHYLPYQDPSLASEYSEEENERIGNETLVGWDFNFDIKDDKIASSFHNIIYFLGKKLAPNLLPYQPTLGFDWRNEIYLWGTYHRPKLSFFTNIEFWFARKANVNLINLHDGIGGTKREFYLAYGVAYYLNSKTAFYLKAFGDNNLNRGTSLTQPRGFKDGSVLGIRYTF